MPVTDPTTTALLTPAASALAALVWAVAALLARSAQTDDPRGPAPVADARPAHAALAVCSLGAAVAAAQLAALLVHLRRGDGAVEPGTWPALTASLTGAAIVARRAVGPLVGLARRVPITDGMRRRDLHAALGAAVFAGVLALLTALVGAGAVVPQAPTSGPYLAPSLAVGAAVLGAHAVLRRGVALVPA